ncbi:hypothetical protein MTO96_006685 [Rhipicephalus appendiculatus]
MSEVPQVMFSVCKARDRPKFASEPGCPPRVRGCVVEKTVSVMAAILSWSPAQCGSAASSASGHQQGQQHVQQHLRVPRNWRAERGVLPPPGRAGHRCDA